MAVKNQAITKEFSSSLLQALESGLHGEVILPGQAGYDQARKIWNGMIDRYPAIIVRCQDASAVARAIRFAREQDLEIAVRSGGHSIPGMSAIDGGIVIDLSPMKDAQVDVNRRTVLAGAGLTLAEFVQATESYGLATTTGVVSDTGIAGLTLGGGIGWFMAKYGLTCDNVLSFTMVTADGEIVQASPGENPDLFWGLRGGGGNFGIVTRFEYQLYPVSTVLGGMILHPLTRAREVLRFYRDFANTSPDELTVYAAIITSPDGQPVIAIIPCYCGDLQEGERVLEPLRKFGPPLADLVHPMAYSEMITLIDAGNPRGRNYYEKGCTLRQLDEQAIELLVEAGESLTSPFSAVLIQHVHGAAARIAPTDTAFSARGESYLPVFLAAWDIGPGDAHIAWARKSVESVRPLAVSVTWVNMMGMEEQNRVADAYGPNYARLVALKRRYDPQNIFRHNLNIRP